MKGQGIVMQQVDSFIMSTIQIQKSKYHRYAEILRHTKFKQIKYLLSDQKDGRCAIGVLMSAKGWTGEDIGIGRKLNEQLEKELGEKVFNELWRRNDGILSQTFSEIADWMDTLE